MRRLPALLLTAALVLPTAACGGDEEQPSALQDFGEFQFPTVSSAEVGTEPTITSKGRAPKESMLKVLTEGDGKPVKAGDVVVANLKGQVWDPGGLSLPPFENSFDGGGPLMTTLEKVIPAWEKKLPGVKAGSRVVLVAPPKEAFPQGNNAANILAVDTVMFVIDVLGSVDPDTAATGKRVAGAGGGELPTVTGTKDPKVTVPDGAPPKQLVSEVLMRGKGAPAKEGQWILAQYTGLLWRNGKEFDSSWKKGRTPFSARLALPIYDQQGGIAVGGVIPGWLKGLKGKPVGSRVLLVIPPADGYGKAGNDQAGIGPKDTLVFVVDIIGAYDDLAPPSAGG